MLQVRDRAFSDPYEFAAAIRGTNTELVLTAKGDFTANTTFIELDRVWLSQTALSIPSLVRSEGMLSRRVLFMLPAAADERPFQFDRAEVSAAEVLTLPAATTHYFRTSGPSAFATMTMAQDDLAATGQAIAGRELPLSTEPRKLRPPAAAVSRLRVLHQAIMQIAKGAPGINPAVTHALEQELAHAMVTCLAGGEAVRASLETVRHLKIMKRFEEYLASRRYEPLYLAELCVAIGVSERTLRTCCQEHLGVGPVRYLWLRRMNLAHRALLRASGADSSVTNVATEHGFWELGRFSVEYRALFGESPSVTLQRRSH